jgi:L-amino acid N-acyltransferase YncA
MAATTTDVEITRMEPGDWPGVAAVYAEGIKTGAATFETEVPSWERWDRDHLDEHRLVARSGGEVIGWAALSRVSIREVYRGVAMLQACGLRVVGRRERLGRREGRRRDVLLLEHRSTEP